MAEAQQQLSSATSTSTDSAPTAPVAEVIPSWNPPELKVKKTS